MIRRLALAAALAAAALLPAALLPAASPAQAAYAPCSITVLSTRTGSVLCGPATGIRNWVVNASCSTTKPATLVTVGTYRRYGPGYQGINCPTGMRISNIWVYRW
jgi:hypothetical protein